MLARQNRRGAVAGVVVAVIVLVLVLGGVWYFVSDPFHQKVKDTFTGQTKWTPENIKKDPTGYLSWAIDQTTATKGKLEAAQLALTKQKDMVSEKLEKATTDNADYNTFLKELKEAYVKADQMNDWPADVRHHKYEKKEMERTIVKCSQHIDDESKKVDTYTAAKNKVTSGLDVIEEQLSKVDTLRMQLSTDLETAKVQATFEGIDNVSSNFDDIVNTSKAMSETAEKNANVKDLMKPSGDARNDEEFNKIMGKGKDAKK